GDFVPRKGAERFDPNWTPVPPLAGLSAALDVAPEWRFGRAAGGATRCRGRLEPLVEVLPGEATLVAFRPEGDVQAVVARLAEADVVVREIPGRGLVRVSCGWWTSEGDLDR